MLPVRPTPPLPARASRAGQARRVNTTGGYPLSPWESRNRGGLYYTRSRKEGGRVIREYIGGGVLGELAAQMDALKRCQRQEEAQALREECERMEALESPLEELYEAAE